ncbi:Nuclease SbcCD subunit D [Sinobacterium norvegicum]|uniref:Nuclease SbcCD subunit D n=1 Tax=Sinobacterium norvegicum TaxID=1641715 RepID=A0ABN8EFJ0_9GAMM|nr:exonuclease subunit SbcD [Sinobacterium norvegicum]CAH0991184.1 Nuclease SbcCD subunit D [Sinobacterium norvegicum]
MPKNTALNSSFKLIHTSDWHLGQHFMGKSRRAEHQQFLAWLIDTAVAQQIDAIIVAGDIFDTGSPPSYARELYNQFVVDLQRTGVHLIILGGNHDSVATLGESQALLACLNTHVIPGACDDRAQQVITLCDGDKLPQAIICAIPFLRPRDITLSQSGLSGSQKQQGLQQAIAEHYHSIYQLAEAQQQQIEQQYGVRLPIIGTGHLTTVGAKSSESVRDIYIGTLEAFPASAFPPLNYIALGHIHRPQKVAGSDHIRYCGSPIPLSFDELSNDKIVLIAEFEGGQFSRVSPCQIPRFQPMHLIKGDLKTIEAEIATLATQYDASLPAWLDIEVSTQDYLNDLQQRIELMIDGLPLEVLLLRRERKLRLQSLATEAKVTLQELTPAQVFDKRLELEDWQGEPQQQKRQRLAVLFDQVVASLNEDANEEAGQ